MLELSHSFYMNDLSPAVSLDGAWEFRLGDGPWQTMAVPSAWEAHTADRLTDGPAVYRRRFMLPESRPFAQVVLEADAISFDATIRVNGQTAGTHRGMWSPFQIDITPYAHLGDNLLEIEVWKPGGRFPLRESLAGFLPDVALPFGGIWQGIRLKAFSLTAVTDLRLFAYEGGWLDVQGQVARLGERRRLEASVHVHDSAGVLVARANSPVGDDNVFAVHLEPRIVRPWEPGAAPALYSVQVSLLSRGAESVRVTRRTGFRLFSAEDETTYLNGVPVHLRGVLDWGWEPARACPTPSRIELRDKFAKARSLGFNMVKLCLHVPDEMTFDVADESGMLLWLEMPMWLPRLTAEARALALREYRDLFQRLHHHPSIAVVSLGCELNAEADASFLDELSRLARAWFPNALHCDNSGSAEAYGGATTALADFYDYHFYADPQFFTPLVQHFDRPYRKRKPWLFGEFCDADTLRDYSPLDPAPWWQAGPLPLTSPDYLATRDARDRLEQAGITDGGAALTREARRQATAVRKHVLEQTRARFPSGGYVVTGWTDTPITTSGVVDDNLELKFRPTEWQQFNADRVLLMDRERRRRWTHGGDRPAHRDPYVWRHGETAEIHLMLSNGLGPVTNARLRWRLTHNGGELLQQGETAASNVEAASVADIATLALTMLGSQALLPVELNLAVELMGSPGDKSLCRNSWNLWSVPKVAAPAYSLEKLRAVSVVDAWSPEVQKAVEGGARAVVHLSRPALPRTHEVPFWREAIHVFEPHALWERVPHADWADMRFFSVASDFALDRQAWAELLGPEAHVEPVWRRFDARAMTWLDYVLDVRLGEGRALITSLRLDGGLGTQPAGLEANPMGAWVLASMVEVLKEAGAERPPTADG